MTLTHPEPHSEAELQALEQKLKSDFRTKPTLWSDMCGLASTLSPENVERHRGDPNFEVVKQMAQACAAKDSGLLLAAWRTKFSIEARTCTIKTFHNPMTFTQLDPDTWQSTSRPGGPCNSTYIDTLTRGTLSFLWNMREVVNRASLTGACSGAKPVETLEYRSDNRDTWQLAQLGCDYVTLGMSY
jgi:hypothetical protein